MAEASGDVGQEDAGQLARETGRGAAEDLVEAREVEVVRVRNGFAADGDRRRTLRRRSGVVRQHRVLSGFLGQVQRRDAAVERGAADAEQARRLADASLRGAQGALDGTPLELAQ